MHVARDARGSEVPEVVASARGERGGQHGRRRTGGARRLPLPDRRGVTPPAGKDHRLPMSALSKASPVLVATFGVASLLASLALPPGGVGSAAADCSPVTVGTDTTSWNGHSRATALGAAEGQTFLARDTLISRLTVWR